MQKTVRIVSLACPACAGNTDPSARPFSTIHYSGPIGLDLAPPEVRIGVAFFRSRHSPDALSYCTEAPPTVCTYCTYERAVFCEVSSSTPSRPHHHTTYRNASTSSSSSTSGVKRWRKPIKSTQTTSNDGPSRGGEIVDKFVVWGLPGYPSLPQKNPPTAPS